MEFIDSHCHLDFSQFDDCREQIIQQAKKLGIHQFIVPSVSSGNWQSVHKLSTQNSEVYFSLGLHPYFYQPDSTLDTELLNELIADKKCVAIGECGVDSSNDNIEGQKSMFIEHIKLANNYKKPLIVHHRKSHHHILQCFKRQPPLYGGVIHAFSGSYQDAQNYLNLGFKLGMGGTITYPRATKTINTLSKLSLNDLVLETDSPDMPLCGYQGQVNTPAQLVLVAQALANILDNPIEEIAKQTTANCKQLFKLN